MAACRSSYTNALRAFLRNLTCGAFACLEPPAAQRGSAGWNGSRGWSAAGGKRVRVEAAPEPDDVNWANLELDKNFERKQASSLLFPLCPFISPSVSDQPPTSLRLFLRPIFD